MPEELPKTVTLPDGQLVPVTKVGSHSEISPEVAVLQRAAERASWNAVQAAFSKGLPVTVGCDGKILRKYPDGREEVIGEYPVQ